MGVFQDNLRILREHYPSLAARIEAMPGKEMFVIGKAQDGSAAYAMRHNGRMVPLTDPIAPQAKIQRQADEQAAQLKNYTRPLFILGLHPGNELLSLFNVCEDDPVPHCPQPIWVCIDSTPCFYGFLHTWDVTKIIASKRVRFFWYEELPLQVNWLHKHPEFPHVFTLISGASDVTLNKVLPPLAQLIKERDHLTEKLHAENTTYYDALSDVQLAELVSGKGSRKPRLMMPTCSWSTFIQHSTRDTCAAFRAQGWDVSELNMQAMLTPYYLTKEIHSFKPDVFLFIDHMRYEAEEVYPNNLLFITWIQDEMDHLFCSKAGESITRYAQHTKRDLVIGYTNQELTKLYGYPKERLVSVKIMADTHIFHPVTLSEKQKTQYDCDLAFMSNVSTSTEQLVEQQIVPAVEKWGMSRETVCKIHDFLQREYRQGKTYCDRARFLKTLHQFDEFSSLFNSLKKEQEEDQLLRLFYWKLNDTLYRHTVLEWAADAGLNLHLYGHGWEGHPRLHSYARGKLEHGLELNAAYQGAGVNLHLNITQGMHQRVWEILAAGATLVFRAREITSHPAPPISLMRKWSQYFESNKRADIPFPESDVKDPATNDWLFRLALQCASTDGEHSNTRELQKRMMEKIESIITSRPDVVIDSFAQQTFNSREELVQLVRRE